MKKLAITTFFLLFAVILSGCAMDFSLKSKSESTIDQTAQNRSNVPEQPVANTSKQAGVNTTSKQNNQNKGTDCEKNGKVFFEVKEVGVKFLVDESIKDDLEYFYKTETDKEGNKFGKLYFGSKQLAGSECATSVYVNGVVVKNPGKITGQLYKQDREYITNRIIKQFDDYFLTFNNSTEPCFEVGSSLEKKYYEINSKGKVYLYPAIDQSLKDCIIEL